MTDRISKNEARWSRRQFLNVTGSLAIGTICGRTWLAAAESDAPAATPQRSAVRERGMKQAPPMQIGILLGTFSRGTLEARLDAVKACGLDSVQVSLDCVGLPAMPDQISPELAGRIRREAAARRITIAAAQGTFNMSHPDTEHRRTGQ